VETGVTYSVVLRPGQANEESVHGLDSDALDEWINAHGDIGDPFEYSSRSQDGGVVVSGDGVIDAHGEAAYRLRS